MGFPPLWRSWINACVTSAAASVIINGTPTTPFKLHRGLRQGDPLSPFLFVLVVEALNLLIQKATSLNLWSGIKSCKKGPTLTHLQYADDTIIFCKPSPDSLPNIQKTLILFQLASGLKVNFRKSAAFGINVDENWLKKATTQIHCKVGCFPLSYLGIPIGGSTSRISSWDPVISRMEKKLSMWKSKTLSLDGRLTLIKSSLSNLPMYFMSLFPIPKGVIQKINAIQRKFLWGGSSEKRGFPLLKWELIQLPTLMGGLNVSNILNRNLGLMFKWLWRFFNEPTALWREIVMAKYRYPSNITITEFSPLYKGGPWKNICNAIWNHPQAKNIAVGCIRKQIGSGEKTFFWHDTWVGDRTLKSLCPRLFSISPTPMASVEDMGYWLNDEWNWLFNWKRNLRPRDMDEWKAL